MGGPSPNWEMCFEMGLTLAEVGRDQKHTLRTGCFLSAEHFPGILLPSCQEAVFILLVEAGIHCYVVCILATMENSQQSRMAPWGSCKVDSWSQTCLFFFFWKCYLALLNQLYSSIILCLPSPCEEKSRDVVTSAVNTMDAILFYLTSVSCYCRCQSQGWLCFEERD